MCPNNEFYIVEEPQLYFFELNQRQRSYINLCIARCREIKQEVSASEELSTREKDEAKTSLDQFIRELEQVEDHQHFMELSHIVNIEIMHWEDRMLGINNEHPDPDWLEYRQRHSEQG